jgi:hypothetical protein
MQSRIAQVNQPVHDAPLSHRVEILIAALKRERFWFTRNRYAFKKTAREKDMS